MESPAATPLNSKYFTPTKEFFRSVRTRIRRAKQEPSQNLGLKVFVIFVIAIGAIISATGALAFLSSQGIFSIGINSFTDIGAVNSSMIMGGGLVLFVLGIAAWIRHSQKERQLHLYRQSTLKNAEKV